MGRPTHELLVERGVVSPEAVVRAEAAAERAGTRLCSELLAAGEATEGALVGILAERHGWPGVDLSRSEILADALRLVPPRVALADNILPLSTEGGRLHLAVADPDSANRVLAEVRFVTGMDICPYVAVAGALRQAIVDAYAGLERNEPAWRGAAAIPGSGVTFLAPVEISLPEGDEVLVMVDESARGGEPEAAAAPAGSGPPRESRRPRRRGTRGCWWSTTSRRSAHCSSGPSPPGDSRWRPPPTARRHWRGSPPTAPRSSCSTRCCRASTGSRWPAGFAPTRAPGTYRW